MEVITILVNLFLLYMLIGLLFGIAFVIWGVTKIDEVAVGSSWRFRLIILPGTIAFWPVLLSKWIKGKRHESKA